MTKVIKGDTRALIAWGAKEDEMSEIEEIKIQTYTPVQGMIICVSGGDYVKSADCQTLLSSLEKEKERAEKLQQRLNLEKLSYNGMEQLLIRERERADKETISVNELSLANQKLESRLKSSESELRKWTAPHDEENLQDAKEQSKQASLAAKQVYINGLEKRVKELETLATKQDELLDLASTRINEAETTLASIKSDPSIGKLEVVDGVEEEEKGEE